MPPTRWRAALAPSPPIFSVQWPPASRASTSPNCTTGWGQLCFISHPTQSATPGIAAGIVDSSLDPADRKECTYIVTSVHQTTAGKMIFGRMDERGEHAMTPPLRQAAVAARGDAGSRVTDSPTFDRHPGPIFPPSDGE